MSPHRLYHYVPILPTPTSSPVDDPTLFPPLSSPARTYAHRPTFADVTRGTTSRFTALTPDSRTAEHTDPNATDDRAERSHGEVQDAPNNDVVE